jgi:hypothetical protein
LHDICALEKDSRTESTLHLFLKHNSRTTDEE